MHSCSSTCLPCTQYWRLITTFFYFGPFSLDLLYHIFFLQRYSRLLEESSGRSPARFSWLLLFASTLLLCMAPLLFMTFLGSALSSTLVYIWSRKNPDTQLSFLGIFIFKAPYLPWVLLCFSLVMHGTVPKDEMCGIVVGHSTSAWYPSVNSANCMQSGTSSTMYTRRCTTTTARWTLPPGGSVSSKAPRPHSLLERSSRT
jgi:hypothetical protein